MLQSLSVGIVDWQRPELVDSYYPEGLPEDWRADFYFNDFRVVLVEQTEWENWSDEFIEELLEIRRKETEVYLKVTDANDSSLEKLAEIHSRLEGWVIGALVFGAVGLGIPALKVTSFMPSLPTSLSEHTWSWNNGSGFLFGAPLGWVENLSEDAKEQRALLENFVKSLGDKKTAQPFFVGGESIKMAHLKQFQTLAELLGF